MAESVDEETEELAKAKAESLRHYNEVELPRQQGHEESKSEKGLLLSPMLGGKARSLLYEGVEANGFHLSAGSTYIYPTNYPVRHYQAAIVKTALFKNTLVSLPTGLGKTFIAAVVMYNFYRWYPHGKVVFMAPTRPLVAQQTKACHHIMNIPQGDTTEMTGAQSAEQRSVLWKEKRVFYLTPQVMVNDLKVKACPASLIKCVVIDEAHRATKDYAYCQVLKILSETDAVFRVLGLSATPGNDISAVQQVVQNLHISALEMRSEESLDVVPYVHSRAIDTVVVELSDNIQRVKEDLLQVYEKYAKKLKDFKALSCNISAMSRFQVLKACEKFRANPPRGLPPAMIGNLYSDFAVCMSLAHALELLQIYGLRAFYTYLSDENADKNKAVATRLKNDEHLKEMLNRLRSCLYAKPNEKSCYTWGHPKLQKLATALSTHFQKAEENKESTKAIIFCQYRVVVNEIVELLQKFKPLIIATEFIGQSGGKDKGMPQAKQLQIMKDFRNGIINCLVATCVAEEGLDIGEVDLIILMEAHKSPVRLVQRIGRTGRKRKGRCIVLLTKGREEQKFHDAMATRKSYVQNIVNASAVKSSLCQESPRMIPLQCNPVQQLVHIHASNFESPARPAVKKQTDIRKCLTAQVPAISNETDLLAAKKELGDLKLTFNHIPVQQELWHRQHDKPISIEELLSKDINGLSEWNEWNHEEHPSFLISHTSYSTLLCHILKVANKEILLGEYYKNADLHCKNNVKENILPTKENSKTKKDLKRSKETDIRTCMALAAEKKRSPEKQIIEILSDADENDLPSDFVEPAPKKLKMSSNYEELELEVPGSNIFTIISVFEERISTTFEKYMTSKNDFKYTFSSKLPDIEPLLDNLSFGILFNLNFNKISSGGQVLKTEDIKSPVTCLGSPLSSTFFEIDDLFDEENSHDKNEVVNNVAENWHYSQKKLMKDYSPKKDVLELEGKEYTENKIEVIGNRSSSNKINFDTEDYNWSKVSFVSPDLNNRINSDVDIGFADSKKNYSSDNTSFITEPVKPAEIAIPQKIMSEDCRQKQLSELETKENVFIKKLPNIRNDHGAKGLSTEKLIIGKCEKFTKTLVEVETKVPPISGIISSTPIASFKKFRKNVLNIENSLPILTENEEFKNEEKDASPTSDRSDMWNLSDLFEDDVKEEEVVASSTHDTTMLGITQMVSLIEKEKKQGCVTAELSSLIKEGSSRETNKNSDFSAFLDSDVDIFSELNENVQEELAKENFVLTQKYNNDELNHNNENISGKTDIIDKNVKLDNHNINAIQSNKVLEKSIKISEAHSMGFVDFQETEKSQHVHQSQPINFKKFSCKKMLFSQKVESQNTNGREHIPEDNSFHINTLKNVQESNESSKTNSETLTGTNADSIVCPAKFFEKISDGLSDDSDDDIFLLPCIKDLERRVKPTGENKRNVILQSYKEKNPPGKKTTKKKKQKANHELIEVEADVSGRDSSDDSEGSSLDDLDNSFINDDSECFANSTQTMYLKSVKSPVGRGKFKIPNQVNYGGNVFSQQVPEDSEYINDSFCVDSDDETDHDNETSLSFLEIAEQKLKNKATKGKCGKNKRRRIRKLSSGSSSSEKSLQRLHDSSEPSPSAVMIRKRRRLNSESETENSPRKDVPSSFKERKNLSNEKTTNNDSSKTRDSESMLTVKATNFESSGYSTKKEISKGNEVTPKHKPKKNKLDESLQKLSEHFAQNLNKITHKYLGFD